MESATLMVEAPVVHEGNFCSWGFIPGLSVGSQWPHLRSTAKHVSTRRCPLNPTNPSSPQQATHLSSRGLMPQRESPKQTKASNRLRLRMQRWYVLWFLASPETQNPKPLGYPNLGTWPQLLQLPIVTALLHILIKLRV